MKNFANAFLLKNKSFSKKSFSKKIFLSVFVLFLLTASFLLVSCGASQDDTSNLTNERGKVQESSLNEAPSDSADSSADAEKKKDLQIEDAVPEGFVKAYVSEVIDGDTIVIALNGREEKVRLIGVDTPESTIRHEPYGKEASNYTKSKLLGRTIYLEKDVSERDKYGRLLRYVWLEVPQNNSESEIRNKMFNAILLLGGYAQTATFPPDVKYTDYFVKFQREAQKNRKGFWGNAVLQNSSMRETSYIGNMRSKKFHRPDCIWAKKISPSNRVNFKSRNEALSSGYVPCKVCRP
ncbi:MAG TPA: nuclease [Peptococcaceae bacterium]|nr:MAG: Prophage LambdaCh01, nuclease domain protein [Clostridia bacterium 41_269]HBT20822.1 nuclease [Peptococcaceae bacterium]